MRVELELIRGWWREDVDYRWVVDAIASRSALGVLKTAIGLCGLAAPLIAVLIMLSSQRPRGPVAASAFCLLIAIGVVWSGRWWVRPWPGETESLVLVAIADVGVTATCALSPGYVVRSVGMSLLLIIGIYVSAFHGPRALAAQAMWSFASAVVLAVPLFRRDDPASAVIMIVGMAAAIVVPPGLQFCYGVLRGEMLSDPLTGLWSRRGLDYYSTIVFARPVPDPACVMVIDLDRFKAVNDAFGHAAGDEVLVCTARRLRAAAPAGSVVARFGGEEFAVIARLPAEVAAGAADRLRRAVAEPVAGMTVTASIGLAVVDPTVVRDRDHSHRLVREMLCRADGAMYQAKQRGGNIVVSACAITPAEIGG